MISFNIRIPKLFAFAGVGFSALAAADFLGKARQICIGIRFSGVGRKRGSGGWFELTHLTVVLWLLRAQTFRPTCMCECVCALSGIELLFAHTQTICHPWIGMCCCSHHRHPRTHTVNVLAWAVLIGKLSSSSQIRWHDDDTFRRHVWWAWWVGWQTASKCLQLQGDDVEWFYPGRCIDRQVSRSVCGCAVEVVIKILIFVVDSVGLWLTTKTDTTSSWHLWLSWFQICVQSGYNVMIRNPDL